MANHPIALQMYTVREITKTPDDYRKVIREVSKIGYDGIEAGPPSDMSNKEFRAFLGDLGLRLTSTWGDVNPETASRIVDQAGDLGITMVVGCWGPDHFATPDLVSETAEYYQRAAELLKTHGLDMLYHNHWWEFDSKVGDRYAWDVLMEQAPTLGCEIDLYWASNFGEVDVPAKVRQYAVRTPLLHVKDGPVVKDEPNTACGKGKMDLPAAISAADDKCLRWLIVELDAYVGGSENVMEAVRDSYAYLASE